MEIVRSSSTTLASLPPLNTVDELIEKRRILVFDSEEGACSVISACLSDEDYDLTYCQTMEDVSAQLVRTRTDNSSRAYELLLWGLTAPFEDGLVTLRELRGLYPDLRIVLLAPQEALAYAAAIKVANIEGLIFKPLHAQDVRAGVERALRKPRMTEVTRILPGLNFLKNTQSGISTAAEVRSALDDVGSYATQLSSGEDSILLNRDEIDKTYRELGLIGTSPEMRKVCSMIRKVGPSRVNVLITGESGSGKEMVAQAIHRVSDRAGKPFIAINCAAIPRELLESELFGHAKGAFTGATNARRGLFEEAHEGTLLLDEIGDLPLSLQAKILRLLQTRQVKPLGQNVSREVDVRIISATHKNLKTLIQKGEFREDLYYRLNVMPIHLPPLRERKDDIILLAEHFLRRYAEKGRGPLRDLTRKACAKLQNLPWKGNVRELENVIERAIVLAEGSQITDTEIMAEEMEPTRVTSEDLFNAGLTLKDIEREYIKYVLMRTGNRKEAATRILGIDRKTLYRKEKLFGIRPNSELN